MSFAKQKGVTIYHAFVEFDKTNPHVYRAFEEYAQDFIDRAVIMGVPLKKIKLSGKLIMELIRWDKKMAYIVDANSEYKINNVYTTHYVRKYIDQYPTREHMFELRTIVSL